ncbi:MAG: hypothetical protein A2Y63_02900 [Candidatus Riflebacteria bacterium RBG_13_59_9]|nr:MAG: hypothetical protein A2Y63_02900 [Candidatus Riflebacteria bacterium RBG_13_59_9]
MPEDSNSLESLINQVTCGDCREILRRIPEETVDLVFADPPYNLQLQNTLIRPNQTKVDAVDDDWDKFASFTEYDEFTLAWLGECRRVLKPNGTIWAIGTYHNIYRIGKHLQDLGYWILNDIVWVKANPMPNFRGVRFTNAHENLIWAVKDKRRKDYVFNYQEMKSLNAGKQMRSDWYLSLCTGEERLKDETGRKLHSTQKPLALLERIILAATKEGSLVLDPFGGTGTTAVAAALHGRRYVLIEVEQRYVEGARERLRRVRNVSRQTS